MIIAAVYGIINKNIGKTEDLMTKREELNVFLERAEDLFHSKYILADIKIVGLLKAIAASELLSGIIENSLFHFDYEAAVNQYFVSSYYGSENKGEFILPDSARDIIALVFRVLLDIDAKKIGLMEFLQEYFCEGGDYMDGYTLWINQMVRPFVHAMKLLADGVIEGRLREPLDELRVMQERVVVARKLEENRIVDEGLLHKVRDLIRSDRARLMTSSLQPEVLADIKLVFDAYVQAVESSDKEKIHYAFVCYQFVALAYPALHLRTDEMRELLKKGTIL